MLRIPPRYVTVFHPCTPRCTKWRITDARIVPSRGARHVLSCRRSQTSHCRTVKRRRQRSQQQISRAGLGSLAQEGWPLWAALSACAAGGQVQAAVPVTSTSQLTPSDFVLQVLEQQTKIGATLSAPLLSLMLALTLSATGIMPVSSPTYDIIWTYVMPLGAALYLLESDLRQ